MQEMMMRWNMAVFIRSIFPCEHYKQESECQKYIVEDHGDAHLAFGVLYTLETNL